MSHEQFWAYTPKQVGMAVQAFWFRLGKRWEHHAWACWHQAAFQRSKKLPELKQLFKQHPAQTQTPEQQAENLRVLADTSSHI